MQRAIVLGGRFLLLRQLGTGGNATVWLAEDLELDGRHVAVKMLHPHLVSVERALERFGREAEILERLEHPHIARAVDFGFDGQVAFIAFEYAEGISLDRELERRSREGRHFTFDEIAAIAEALASGLDYAHRRGVIHRDLKPANLILSTVGPKIIDFGIAHITRSEDEATTLGRLMGSMLYLSPEQSEGERVDGRTDVFALAAVVFELLTLRRAFARDEIDQPLAFHLRKNVGREQNAPSRVLERICGGARPRPSALRAEVSSEVDRVLDQALAVDPADRYGTAGDFADAFISALEPPAWVTAVRPKPQTRQTARTPQTAQTPAAPADPSSSTEPAVPARSLESKLRIPVVAVLSGASIALGLSAAGTQATVVQAVLPVSTAATRANVLLEPAHALDFDEVEIPAGAFTAGCAPGDSRCADDERPGRTGVLAKFAIDRLEVSVQEYRSCFDSGACSKPGDGPLCNFARADRDAHPINCVDARQASAFCRWRNRRLPTSDEWEKSARGDDARIYPWGGDPPSCARASFGGCGGETHEVGVASSGASAYGVLDLAGNVWEWTSTHNKSGRRIIRGGSFFDVEDTLRASNKGSADPASRLEHVGFRCARDL